MQRPWQRTGPCVRLRVRRELDDRPADVRTFRAPNTSSDGFRHPAGSEDFETFRTSPKEPSRCPFSTLVPLPAPPPTPATDDDRGLLDALAAGDATAWQATVRRYEGLLRSAARVVLRSDADIDEAVQRTWVLLVRLPRRRTPASTASRTADPYRAGANPDARRAARRPPRARRRRPGGRALRIGAQRAPGRAGRPSPAGSRGPSPARPAGRDCPASHVPGLDVDGASLPVSAVPVRGFRPGPAAAAPRRRSTGSRVSSETACSRGGRAASRRPAA